jgi:hypothetical protein
MNPLHATIEEFAADGFTHVECYCPVMALAAARRDKPAAAAMKAARPSKALMGRAPRRPLAASRLRAPLPAQPAFPPKAPRQQVALQEKVAQQVLPPQALQWKVAQQVLPQQALQWKVAQQVLPQQAPRQAVALRAQRVPRLPVPPVPPRPRQQALWAQRVPLFRLLPVLRCLAP